MLMSVIEDLAAFLMPHVTKARPLSRAAVTDDESSWIFGTAFLSMKNVQQNVQHFVQHFSN